MLLHGEFRELGSRRAGSEEALLHILQSRDGTDTQTEPRHCGLSQTERGNLVFLLPLLEQAEVGERETSATALLAACQVLSPSIIGPLEAISPCLPPLSSWESLLAAPGGCFIASRSCWLAEGNLRSNKLLSALIPEMGSCNQSRQGSSQQHPDPCWERSRPSLGLGQGCRHGGGIQQHSSCQG